MTSPYWGCAWVIPLGNWETRAEAVELCRTPPGRMVFEPLVPTLRVPNDPSGGKVSLGVAYPSDRRYGPERESPRRFGCLGFRQPSSSFGETFRESIRMDQ